MTTRLHLIRHARPNATPGTPPKEWPLAPEPCVADLAAADVLPAGARWFSSPEPKALQTASLLTDATVQVLEGLAETGRDEQMLPAEQFRQTVSDYLTAGVAPAGWESRVDATLRIVNTAQAAMELTQDGDCVLVGHGTAFTLLVAALVGRAPDVAAWRAMRMPDHCALRPGPGGAFEVVSPWGGWLST